LWGRQGVGGIVVVSAFYVCLLIARRGDSSAS